MDPTVAIDPYLHDLIFQHFAALELTEVVSLISPEWSRIIGSSRTCMNKVKFSYQVRRHYQIHTFSEVFQCAQKTWRDYQHVIVECQHDDDSEDFWKFIERCCSSLVTLKVENVSRSAGAQFSATFPRLKVFNADSVKDLVITSVLTSTVKLEELSILTTTSMMDPFMVQCLVKVLQRNRRLKNIYLKNVQRTLIDPNERVTDCSFLDIFEEPFQVDFQLKSLKLLDAPKKPLSTEVQENILAFLASQRDSLETFSFEFHCDKVLEFGFNSLSALTSLGFTNSHIHGLKKNSKITNLEIPYIDETSVIKQFIEKTPNLKTLFAGAVSKELIEHLAWNFTNLRSLNFKWVDLDGEEFYERFKAENPDVNQEIEIWDYEIVDWD